MAGRRSEPANPGIVLFAGEYRFLSNFYAHLGPITNEHLFQAMKCVLYQEQIAILHAPSPREAKRMGRACVLRADWEDIKNYVMLQCLREKFAHGALRHSLSATGNATLVEGNDWHDQYWGNCVCPKHITTPGKNMLGVLLMQVRGEIAL